MSNINSHHSYLVCVCDFMCSLNGKKAEYGKNNMAALER